MIPADLDLRRAASLALALEELVRSCTLEPGLSLIPNGTVRQRAGRVLDGADHPALLRKDPPDWAQGAGTPTLSRALQDLLAATGPVRRGGGLRAPDPAGLAAALAIVPPQTRR